MGLRGISNSVRITEKLPFSVVAVRRVIPPPDINPLFSFANQIPSLAESMSDNPSFVLRGIDDVVYEQRLIPEREAVSTS
jgi:hypothetical protein